MENTLEHLAQFRQILGNYHISDHAKPALERTKLVLLVAPTSTGRNTIIKELVKTGDYHYIVSDTTRHPRVNNGVPEQNGREYWFRSEAQVLQDLKNGEFLEAAIIHNQQVSGISMRELESARREGKFAVTDIEIVGAENIYRLKPDSIVIFMLPPNFKEWTRRLQSRGNLPAAEIHRRLESAHRELTYALTKDYYFFVVNDTINDTVRQIEQIVHDPTPDHARGDRGRQVASGLDRMLEEALANYEQAKPLNP